MRYFNVVKLFASAVSWPEPSRQERYTGQARCRTWGQYPINTVSQPLCRPRPLEVQRLDGYAHRSRALSSDFDGAQVAVNLALSLGDLHIARAMLMSYSVRGPGRLPHRWALWATSTSQPCVRCAGRRRSGSMRSAMQQVEEHRELIRSLSTCFEAATDCEYLESDCHPEQQAAGGRRRGCGLLDVQRDRGGGTRDLQT